MYSVLALIFCLTKMMIFSYSSSPPITTKVVPDDFYDGEVEKEKSFLDVAATLNGSGLEGLTIQKVCEK